MTRRPPRTRPTQSSHAVTPHGSDEGQDLARLVREDREHLSRFVDNLNRGLTAHDMDNELKAWFLDRH